MFWIFHSMREEELERKGKERKPGKQVVAPRKKKKNNCVVAKRDEFLQLLLLLLLLRALGMRRKEMDIFTANSDQLFLLIFECLECINKARAHEPWNRREGEPHSDGRGIEPGQS